MTSRAKKRKNLRELDKAEQALATQKKNAREQINYCLEEHQNVVAMRNALIQKCLLQRKQQA